MPASPRWISHINEITLALIEFPREHIDTASVQSILGVSRRRAQQLMAPCVCHKVGSSGLARRDSLIHHLQTLAAGEGRDFERDRRQRVAGVIEGLRRQRVERPQVLVEAPLEVTSRQLTDLPEGVRLAPGRITVEFAEPREALEKLLALAMAIGNDFQGFEQVVRSTEA
jgi:hypothetical protein